MYYQFSLWYNWSQWNYFALLLNDIQFHFWGFFFLNHIQVFLCAIPTNYNLNCWYYYCKFFTPELADGFSLKTEWQQVFSDLQDSSQYSGQSSYIMPYFGWSWIVLWFLTFPVPFPSIWGSFQVCQLQLVSLLLSCSITFFSFSGKVQELVFVFISFILWFANLARFTIRQVVFFC